jgi:hypothetical protein
MFTQHPTLLIGPSDWQPERFPKTEFDRRITALWGAYPQAAHAIVFGNASHHAELAYLTNFTPKLEPGIALLARDGDHKLLFGGGPNMIGAMKPLTFITEMAPLGALGKAVAGWSPLLIGGDEMPVAMRKTVADATGGKVQDASGVVRALMRRKSPVELAAIGDACSVLDAAVATIANAHRAGDGVTAAVLAGERAAIERGAQDVRTLFSLDGGRTLRPFEAFDERHIDRLQVYVAVRLFNYWAEGFATVSNSSQPAASLAALLLDNALSAIGAGVPFTQLARITAVTAPYRTHPAIQGASVEAIGLALGDPPDAAGAFEAGEVYSVRVGLTDGGGEHAIVSAMIAMSATKCDVLWRTGIA